MSFSGAVLTRLLYGYMTTLKIRKMDDHLVARLLIIAITAHAMSEDYQKGPDVGMNDFLVHQ